jgi:phage gp36-like protein
MPYVSATDLGNRIGIDQLTRLSDRDGDGVADTGVIDAAIAEADGVIDGYLAGRYDLPLSSPPALLTTVACDLILYALHPWGAPEDIRNRRNDAIKMLESIANGKLVLDGRTPSTDTPQWGDALPVMTDPRKMGF